MSVTYYADGTLSGSEVVDGNSFTLKNVPTNVKYEFVFKLTDGTNYSAGVVKNYLREGASSISGVTLAQVENGDVYDALVTWNKPEDANKVYFTATNGTETITETFNSSTESYTIPNVISGDIWQVSFNVFIFEDW